jgi:hypothetical protein
MSRNNMQEQGASSGNPTNNILSIQDQINAAKAQDFREVVRKQALATASTISVDEESQSTTFTNKPIAPAEGL